VDVEDIKGQAFMGYWPFKDSTTKLWEVWKMVGNVRFDRIGKRIRSEPVTTDTSK